MRDSSGDHVERVTGQLLVAELLSGKLNSAHALLLQLRETFWREGTRYRALQQLKENVKNKALSTVFLVACQSCLSPRHLPALLLCIPPFPV